MVLFGQNNDGLPLRGPHGETRWSSAQNEHRVLLIDCSKKLLIPLIFNLDPWLISQQAR